MQRTVAAVMMATICVGCSEHSPNPLRPSTVEVSDAAAVQLAVLPNSHGLTLTPVVGKGHGKVNVTPTADQIGFSVETQVAVWQTRSETTFDVKRAVDVNSGGACSSTDFVQLPLPNLGPLVKLTTSPGGAGTVHVKFALPQLAEGNVLAVRFQVSSEDLSIVLQTECFTVPVR